MERPVKGTIGAFADGTTRLDIGNGLWVEVHSELSAGQQRELQQSFVQVDGDGKFSVKGDPTEANFKLMDLAIVSWNFEHEQDGVKEIVSVCRDNFYELKASVKDKILLAINDLYAQKAITPKKEKS